MSIQPATIDLAQRASAVTFGLSQIASRRSLSQFSFAEKQFVVVTGHNL
jgi:hypothetical protein